jgi:chromosome segregation ATPase
MERNYDEVISEMLIQLDEIERRWKKLDARMEKADKRLDMSIKRLVKAEQRLEKVDDRMEEFDKKLKLSIKDQRAHSQLQGKVNATFLKQLSQQTKLLDSIIRKNGLKA